MYTLAKSEQTKLESRVTGSRAFEQKKQGHHADFDLAFEACDQADREHTDRHYLMDDAGKEFYADIWFD